MSSADEASVVCAICQRPIGGYVSSYRGEPVHQACRQGLVG